ncbi:MAG: bifunctional homocysteine S-methyltransferase/methylenetetrahydrofolate reductase [Firmicutes bacterium]|nr:bifunctional homocysteine S-methyltransferase/methylenetetrahydrofolate reductase [Bacillota bacterium]
MKKLQEQLKTSKVLFDGAFGTYYAKLYETHELPELANCKAPERVERIHSEYLEAGAQILRANTFACNTASMDLPWEDVERHLRAGYRIAKEAVRQANASFAGRAEAAGGIGAADVGHPCWAAADIGPIPYDDPALRETVMEEYKKICRAFLEEGAEVFVFETFSDLEDIREAIELIGDQAFVLVSFAMNQFGYSNSGLSARKLMQQAAALEAVDAAGFNCGIGPAHMQQIIRGVDFPGKKWVTAVPNAGYPQFIGNRMSFDAQNIEYFAGKVSDIAADGVNIIGGCCGTTPEYIRRIRELTDFGSSGEKLTAGRLQKEAGPGKDLSFFKGKEGKKLIAVELAPPAGSDDERLMEAAHLLMKNGVDVVTFPDSPSGRTRADSILMAEKVARETGMCVMPHICCRDKNAIAMRSQLLGSSINHIHNFLVITGDPIPTMVRSSVKSVFNFDAVGLMNIIADMNEDQFGQAPLCYGGAINQTRKNLEAEIDRVKRKLEAGASFFLTQPVSTAENAERVRVIKEATGARILCGIMPFVSRKNAVFMKNELTGIDVPDEVLLRYRDDMTKEEGEAAAVQLAKDMMALTADFADGYYFSFPFNRVELLEKILQNS